MKKIVLFLLIILAGIYFSEVLNAVKFEGLVTISQEELKPVYEKYIGFDVNDFAINDIVSSIKSTGYFSSVEWTKIATENSFDLIISVKENIPVEQINLNIDGVGLISRETLEASITLKVGKAFSFVQFRNSIENLTKLYEKENYIVSNVFSKVKDQSFIYITGKINGNIIDFNVKEYALYDIEFTGSTEGLEDILDKIKKEVDLKLYKNYLKKNPLLKLFDSEKNYYPKSSDIQKLYQVLSNYVYFSNLSNIRLETVNTQKPAKTLKIFVVQNIITKEPVQIQKIMTEGVTLYSFDDLATTPATFSNVDLLHILQKIKDTYEKDEYIINLFPELKGNEFVVHVVEYKFGNLNIKGNTRTKIYTFDDLIKVKPEDYASKKALRETYIEIYKTQFFDNIDYDITPTGTNTLDVTLLVEEKEKRFNFIGGGTWGPPGEGKQWYEGFAAELQLKTINPFGFGQTFGTTISLGFAGKNISLDYGIRKPFGSPLSILSSLSYLNQPSSEIITQDATTSTEVATDLTSFNFDFSISTLKLHNMSYSFGAGVSYKFTETNIATTVDSSVVSSSTSVSEYVGGNILLGISYETLDDLIIPTEGLYLNLVGQKYFRFTGDAPVALKTQEEFSLHFPIKNTYFGLATRIYASQVFQQSGVDMTNYLEGLYSLRGAQLKGDVTLLINNDFRYINKEGQIPFYAAVFVDFGYVGETYDFSTPFEWSAGLELGINIPMFGLVRVGNAFYNDNWNFFFLMGKTF
ncbi:MAG: BamA/TamA family outer membrane protein [Thermosipho sp. (in: Bacteria)]|nr:BamA/TamA family outer membrane protein [Thermosipho sp. (in: thermotogales)]